MDRLFYFLTDLSGGVAYAIIFGILVACGLGFPLPEDIPLVATGYLVWDGTMSWAPALGVTLIGVLAGDSVLFFIGRKLGLKFLDQGKLGAMIKPEKVRRVRAYFRKYGDKIVFFARFVAGFRAAAFFMAGVLKMPYRKFVWLDGLAALLSVPIWIALGYGLGYYLGDEISTILERMKHFKDIATGVIAVVAVAIVVKVYFQLKSAKKKKALPRARAKIS